MNMALDAALLEAVRDGARCVLRLYRWDHPTLSFGRNQPARGRYDEHRAQDRGIAFVRRPTGGQAVLHADELTYAVVAPVSVIGRPRAAYRRINEALVMGLRAMAVPAAVWGRTQGHGGARGHAWEAACFRDAAEGEVVVGGRKLVGSAQRCEGRVILQHGSILVSGSQSTAEWLVRREVGAPPAASPAEKGGRPDWTTLEEELGQRPEWSTLAAGLVAGFERVFGTALAPAGLSVEESTRARALRAKFASREWTWRR